MISVVIPTYNHRDYVLDTLQSVFNQTRQDYEIIVVNDGSPDDTAERLKPLADAGRIVYIEQVNAGQGAARNRGIEAARGEYIALLDDDDLWAPDKLEWQAAILDSEPDTVLAYGDYARIERNGRVLPVETHCPSGAVRDEFLHACWILSPGQTLIRASALRRIGGFDTAIWGSDDWDLYIRLAAVGRFHHERRVALHYRLHDTNASRHAVRHVQNHFKVMAKHMRWNLPRIAAHLREASRHFVPNLLRCGHEMRVRGDYAGAVRAHFYALTFRPTLLIRRPYWAALAGSFLKRPPRH